MDNTIHPYQFNSELDYFSGHMEIWQTRLQDSIGKKVDMLEIGSLEGRCSTWALENILTHPEATLTCVDLPMHTNIYCILLNNLSHFDNKVRVIGSPSMEALPLLMLERKRFDIIYIDGAHTSYHPLYDMVLCHDLLRLYGTMIIDDYKMIPTEKYGDANVYRCLNSFMEIYGEFYNPSIPNEEYQQWIQKIRI